MYVPTSHIDQVFSATRLNNKQQLEVILQTFIKNVRLGNNSGTGGFQVTKKNFFLSEMLRRFPQTCMEQERNYSRKKNCFVSVVIIDRCLELSLGSAPGSRTEVMSNDSSSGRDHTGRCFLENSGTRTRELVLRVAIANSS
jgi:hypothetical protein